MKTTTIKPKACKVCRTSYTPTSTSPLASEELKVVHPCKKCGSIERYKNRSCKVCANLASAAYRAADPGRKKAVSDAWYAANKERVNATSKAWKEKNPERRRATTDAWRAANSERIKKMSLAWNAANSERKKVTDAAWIAANPANPEVVKANYAAWAKANPEKLRINNQNRAAKKRENGGKLSHGLSAKLFKLQKGKCPCCALPLGDNYHLDHKMPLALGGANTDDNIQLLRARCNIQKKAKHPVDFMQERGFLL